MRARFFELHSWVMRCLLVRQRIGSSVRDGDHMVDNEGPWVRVGQRVVDGLPADVADGFGPHDLCAMLLTQGVASLGHDQPAQIAYFMVRSMRASLMSLRCCNSRTVSVYSGFARVKTRETSRHRSRRERSKMACAR